jgi:serine/threonine-protein phosphatase 6 regulatory ankyrin repeat subunit B
MTSMTSLFATVESGDIDSLRRHLDDDPCLAHARLVLWDEDGTPKHGRESPTLLQAAAQAGHLEIVKLLLERGADIYETALWGYPAVEHAFWAKQQHVVDYFLGEAASHATMGGCPTYGLGIDVNLAARNGWLELVRNHVRKDRLAVHRRGVIGETPLHWAGHNGFVEIVRLLLDAGADIEADEIGCYGGKPLHFASEHEPEVVRLLVERGADVNSRNVLPGGDFEGATPLIMLAQQHNDCAECAEILIEAGADIGAVDAGGKTALAWAVECGVMRVQDVLRKAGAV